MQHIIPTKVPYILFKLSYIFLYYIFQLAATYYKVKHKPLRGVLFFSHNGLCFFTFYASSLFMLLLFLCFFSIQKVLHALGADPQGRCIMQKSGRSGRNDSCHT